MADEKLNVSPEENPQPSLFDAGLEGAPAQDVPALEPPAPENAPEQTGGEPPAQDAPTLEPPTPENTPEQAAPEKVATKDKVEPEQPPTPAPEDKAAEDKGPAKKGKTTGEKTPEPEKPKAKRGRKPKEEKAGPSEPGRFSPKTHTWFPKKPLKPLKHRVHCHQRDNSPYNILILHISFESES